MPISTQNAAALPPAEPPGDTAESLGAQALALLPALRLYSLSVFDAKGDVQWLSEGALGPDEQTIVEEAIAALIATQTRAHHEAPMGDNRAALFLAVRTPRATLAGVVMVLTDTKTLHSGNLAARILTTSMRSVLQKLALLLAPPPPLGATGTMSGIRPFSSGTVPVEVAVMPGASIGDTANASMMDVLDWQQPAASAAAKPGDARALQILEAAAQSVVHEEGLAWTQPGSDPAEILIEADPMPVTRTDEVQALVPAAMETSVSGRMASPQLRLRELIRLRPGGRTRRYQVVAVAEQQRGNALVTLNLLLEWLQQHPQVLEGDPVSFTIAVAAQSLSDPELPAALAAVLAGANIEPGILGFELREIACLTHPTHAERFIAQCERSRCFAVIDDFTFNTGVLELLRSGAVRMVKVESKLIASALRDKLSQARVVAIAQAAKVLGTHCAAKYVDSQSGRRWLTAVGFDFTQSSTTEAMQRLCD